MNTPEKPNIVNDEHLEFLDRLRESGKTNMFGAAPFLQKRFPELAMSEASKVLAHWMETFSERHKSA